MLARLNGRHSRGLSNLIGLTAFQYTRLRARNGRMLQSWMNPGALEKTGGNGFILHSREQVKRLHWYGIKSANILSL